MLTICMMSSNTPILNKNELARDSQNAMAKYKQLSLSKLLFLNTN